MLLDLLHRRQPAAGKISVRMNFTNRATSKVSGIPRSAISGKVSAVMVCSSITPSSGSVVGHGEEVVVAVEAEMLERADRHDPVDRLVELLPALQLDALAARVVRLGE
jgi:hypothetical protein